MACCYPEDCVEYAVSPMLVAPCYPTKCFEDPPMCFPCLPRCPKPQAVYCCEKKPRTPPRTSSCHDENCCEGHQSRRHRDSTPPHQGKYSTHSARNTSTTKCPPPNYCPTCSQPTCKPVKTKYVIPCYRYEDGRIVHKLPVSAFKRNGMQDQEHSKLLGTANFLQRCPRDVAIECDVCTKPVKVGDPAKVPPFNRKPPLDCGMLKKKPIKVSLGDILDD